MTDGMTKLLLGSIWAKASVRNRIRSEARISLKKQKQTKLAIMRKTGLKGLDLGQ